MYRDTFGEPPSHSTPIGGIEEFDAIMHSPETAASRVATLIAIAAAGANVLKDTTNAIPQQ